jgi:hypothetical protein
MATSDNSNQTVGSQSTNNSPTGNGNFSFSGGKWQSTDGSSLDGSGGSGSSGFGGSASGGNNNDTSLAMPIHSLVVATTSLVRATLAV